MTNLSQISFQAVNKTSANTNKKVNKEPNTQTTQTIPNSFPKSLLALAVLGAATLQSCVMTETLDSLEQQQSTQIQEVPELPETTPERVDNMLNSLGLLTGDNKSIYDVKTISFSDEIGNRNYLEPCTFGPNGIVLNKLVIHPDYTGTESRVLIQKNDHGIDVTNITDNDSIKSKYVMTGEGISEFKSLNGILVENSKISKREDGTIVQKFADGNIKYFNDIENNETMPTKISFDASVDNWKDVHSDIIQ